MCVFTIIDQHKKAEFLAVHVQTHNLLSADQPASISTFTSLLLPAEASLLRLGNSTGSQVSHVPIRKWGASSKIASRESASASTACTRMTAVSLKEGVSVHCTMETLPIQPIDGRHHSARTFQATLGTKCSQKSCWRTAFLAGGWREHLHLLTRWGLQPFLVVLFRYDLLDDNFARIASLERLQARKRGLPDLISELCISNKVPVTCATPLAQKCQP